MSAVPADVPWGAARFEAPMQRIIEQSPSALTWWDRDLVCRFANRACIDWFGIDPELIVGCRMADLLMPSHPQGLPLAAQALAGHARTMTRRFDAGGRGRGGVVVFLPDWDGARIDGVVMHVSPDGA